MDTLAITHTLIPHCLVLSKSFMTRARKVEEKMNCKYADISSVNGVQNLSRQAHLARIIRSQKNPLPDCLFPALSYRILSIHSSETNTSEANGDILANASRLQKTFKINKSNQ